MHTKQHDGCDTYTVQLFLTVRVAIPGVMAKSPEEAVSIAEQMNLDGLFQFKHGQAITDGLLAG